MSIFFILLISGYLLGSIPFGFLISKTKGINIREVGSGNIGTTNVLRALGLKWAVLVLILDVSKGIIPTLLAVRFLVFDWQIALVAVSPILGHIFPVWLRFKGGKGIATIFAVLLVLLNWKIFLIWFLVWISVLVSSKIMSFTNLLMVSFLPLAFWLDSFSLVYLTFGVFLFILVWWTHRENLRRIAQDKEPKVRFKGRGSKT